MLGECAELGADPIVWRVHLAQGCSALIDDHFVSLVESRLAASPAGAPAPVTLGYFHGGALPNERFDLIDRFMEAPADLSPTVPAVLKSRQPSLTHLRRELVPDREWYRSEYFQDYLRPLGLRDQVVSVALEAPQVVSALCWLSYRNRQCTARAARLLDLLHKEFTRLKSQGRLAPLRGFSLADLAPRQREILFGLFQGDSEKQLACRLGISRHTAHDYLKALHRRLGASTRGELMSRLVAFWPALRRMQESCR